MKNRAKNIIHRIQKLYQNEFGMTMMEIMVVLVLIAGMMALTISALGPTEKNNMRRASGQIIRLVKYVYNQSALTSEYYRIVFDLSEQKFFVEYSDSPFYIVRQDDEQEMIRIKHEEKDRDEEDEETEFESTGAALGDFVEFDDDLLEIFELPKNIKIMDIYVEHHKEPVDSGKVYLYFFPRGFTEFAVIHISDEDEENFMTLVVNPLTATVEIIKEYLEYEDLLHKLGQI